MINHSKLVLILNNTVIIFFLVHICLETLTVLNIMSDYGHYFETEDETWMSNSQPTMPVMAG